MPQGVAGFLCASAQACRLNRELSLIGAPADSGARIPGASLGPQALRGAGVVHSLRGLGCQLRDCGDLSGPPYPNLPPADGYRHLAEVTAWAGTVHDAVRTELAQGRLPLLLGGDHSVAIGSISAVARHCRVRGRPLRVLWFDAQADCNSRHTSPSGNLHGMPVACLCGLGPSSLTGLSGLEPAIAPTAIREIGIRSVDPGEVQLVHELGLEVFDMRALATLGMHAVMRRALAGLEPDAHLHVSFDVDFLDPGVAPGVATMVGDGASLADAQLAMKLIAATGRLASVDIVELNPTLDQHHRTAEVVVKLLVTLFDRRTAAVS